MKKDLIVTHNAGFFSCAGVKLAKIYDFYLENKVLPTVDSSNQWHYYKDNFNIDVTYDFFKPENPKTIEFKPFKFINGYDGITQFCDYEYIDYENLSFLIDEYFSPSEKVLEIKNNIIKKYNLNLNEVITVLYRGNDKITETNVPSYEDMLLKTLEIKNKSPKYKILVQTDEFEFAEFMKKNFKDCIIFEESKMINKNIKPGLGTIQHNLKIGEKVKYSQIFLAIMLIMSESSKIIMTSGNVGMWVCLYRKNSKNIYQHLNPKEDGFIHEKSIIVNNWIDHE